MASSINLITCNVPIPADHDWLLYTDIVLCCYFSNLGIDNYKILSTIYCNFVIVYNQGQRKVVNSGG